MKKYFSELRISDQFRKMISHLADLYQPRSIFKLLNLLKKHKPDGWIWYLQAYRRASMVSEPAASG